MIYGVGSEHDDPDCWYVDLVEVSREDRGYVVRDLYIDLIVPGDGRPYRTLDLDEFADAIAASALSVNAAIDGLRRWQKFLDRYVHSGREADTKWTDFPPRRSRRWPRCPLR